MEQPCPSWEDPWSHQPFPRQGCPTESPHRGAATTSQHPHFWPSFPTETLLHNSKTSQVEYSRHNQRTKTTTKTTTMLIKESHADVTTTVNGVESSMRIFVFHPTIPQYPNAYAGAPLVSITQETRPPGGCVTLAKSSASPSCLVLTSTQPLPRRPPLQRDLPGHRPSCPLRPSDRRPGIHCRRPELIP